MDKYERIGKKYAKENNQTIIKSNNEKIHVYEPNGYKTQIPEAIYRDIPDDTFENWKDYTRYYIGNNLRKLRKNNNKHLRRN